MKSIFNKIKYYFEKQKLFNRVSLEQSNFSILDTETTGLNVSKGDKVISVASLKINNFKIQEDLFLNELVNPQIKIPEESTKIAHVMSHQYEGLMKKANLKNKGGMGSIR